MEKNIQKENGKSGLPMVGPMPEIKTPEVSSSIADMKPVIENVNKSEKLDDKISKSIQEAVDAVLVNLFAVGDKTFHAILQGRVETLNFWKVTIDYVESIRTKFNMEIEPTYLTYFMPALVSKFGKKGFSFKTYERYKGILNDPDKTKAFLDTAFEATPERKAQLPIDEQVMNTIKRCNDTLDKALLEGKDYDVKVNKKGKITATLKVVIPETPTTNVTQ